MRTAALHDYTNKRRHPITFLVHPRRFFRIECCDNLWFNTSDMALVKCPQCGNESEYEGNEFRPFCSERCKLLDFGDWADEHYALPTEGGELSEEDWDKIEKALEDNENL